MTQKKDGRRLRSKFLKSKFYFGFRSRSSEYSKLFLNLNALLWERIQMILRRFNLRSFRMEIKVFKKYLQRFK